MFMYKYPTIKIPHVKLMSFEHLTCDRPHVTRITQEFILYYIVDGCLKIRSGDEILVLSPGDIHIFNKGDFQHPVESSDCEYYYLHFFDDFESEDMTDAQIKAFYSASQQFFVKNHYNEYDMANGDFNYLLIPKQMNVKSSPYIKKINFCFKNGAFDRFSEKSEHYNFKSNIYASELFLYLHRSYSEQILDNAVVFNEASVKKLMEYIDQNIEKHITSKQLESVFTYSFDHMNRCFKRITGQSIFSYLTESRINQAKILLYTKNLSISQVAEQTGFCSIYHFSSTFRKHTGCSPSEYVKNVINP